jgi:hypothetical protein
VCGWLLVAGQQENLLGNCVWMAADGWVAGEALRDMCVDGLEELACAGAKKDCQSMSQSMDELKVPIPQVATHTQDIHTT